MVWLLLFGQLFSGVAELPGFGGGTYLDYLTPGVVVMTAMFSAGWTGMAFIAGHGPRGDGPDPGSPVRRGAMIGGSLAYQAVITVVQSLIDVRHRPAGRGPVPGRRAGLLVVLAGRDLLAAVFAALSNAIALLVRSRRR